MIESSSEEEEEVVETKPYFSQVQPKKRNEVQHIHKEQEVVDPDVEMLFQSTKKPTFVEEEEIIEEQQQEDVVEQVIEEEEATEL